jgi:hypothetical protein
MCTQIVLVDACPVVHDTGTRPAKHPVGVEVFPALPVEPNVVGGGDPALAEDGDPASGPGSVVGGRVLVTVPDKGAATLLVALQPYSVSTASTSATLIILLAPRIAASAPWFGCRWVSVELWWHLSACAGIKAIGDVAVDLPGRRRSVPMLAD